MPVAARINFFPKSNRLLSSKDFDYLKFGSKRIQSRNIRAYYKKTSVADSVFTRVGFSVSRKVGKAVTRNRLKRIFRNIFRLSNSKHEGLDIIFVVSPRLYSYFDSATLAEQAISREFTELLDRISKKH